MKLTWVEYQIQLTLKSEGRDFPGSQSQDRTQGEGCCIGLYLASESSAFRTSLNLKKKHNYLFLLIQPMLNMKDIGRPDLHTANLHFRSLSFKNVCSLSISTFLPFPDRNMQALHQNR